MLNTDMTEDEPSAANIFDANCETTVADLTAHLQQANSLRAEAERSDQLKTRFLANMSHEIRTPMNAVLGFAALLLDSKLSPQQTSYVEHIQRAAEAMLGVINDYLDLSKIEAGRIQLDLRPVHLQSLVEEVLDLLKVRIGSAKVELIFRLDPAIPAFIVSDPNRLRQLLINLGSNAVKFTEQGHIYLNFSLKERQDETYLLLVEIEDTGIGIHRDELEKIFEDYIQARISRHGAVPGTGLGLAICRKLVTLLGGEIGVESIEHVGSTFWFTLPCEKAGAPMSATSKPLCVETDLSALRTIAVDDEVLNQEMYRQLFERWQIPLDVVASGEEALRLMKRAAKEGIVYSFAIIDNYLPGMSGVELAHYIRRDAALKSMQLILCSSAPLAGEADQMHEKGFSAYFSKPFNAHDLFEAMLTLARNHIDQPTGKPDTLITRHTLREQRRGPLSKPHRHFNAHILVVEDNDVNQMIARALLEKYGCEVTLASNGLEAINLATRHPYDLIFMDCLMPELDGYDATLELRERERSDQAEPRTIIALTAQAMQGDREKCLKSGMDDYISKPIREEELLRMLEKWLP